MVHCANPLQNIALAMPQHLSDVLNACERAGKLNVRGKDLHAKLPDASHCARRCTASSGPGGWCACPAARTIG